MSKEGGVFFGAIAGAGVGWLTRPSVFGVKPDFQLLVRAFREGDIANDPVLQEYLVHFGVAVLIGGLVGYALGAVASR